MLNCIERNGYNFVLLDSLQELELSNSGEELDDLDVNVPHLPEFKILPLNKDECK